MTPNDEPQRAPAPDDASDAHARILEKLESIERRLDRLERAPADVGDDLPTLARNGLAAATDTIDEEVARLRDRGVDVDARARALLPLLERLTDERVVASLGRVVERIEALEPLVEVAAHGANAMATFTDVLDDEVARAATAGLDVDAALRNGVTALLYLGQRVSTKELEALGTLLRSDVLHPSAIDVIGRLGDALVEAADAPAGSVGPLGALSKLGDRDTRRSTAFALEFARRFGAGLADDDVAGTTRDGEHR